MVTIVTDVEPKEGAERKWDAVTRERMTEAPGVGGRTIAALGGRSEQARDRRHLEGALRLGRVAH